VDGRLVRIFNTYGPHMNPVDGRVTFPPLRTSRSTVCTMPEGRSDARLTCPTRRS